MRNADDRKYLPASVTYLHGAGGSGFAAGMLVIHNVSEEGLRGYHLYWGSAAGEKLPDYTKIAFVAASASDELRYHFPAGLLIPEGAEAILVFPVCYRSGTDIFYEADCFAAAVVGAAPFRTEAKRRSHFAVITDLHVTVDPGHPHNLHLKHCLSEINRLSPDALGIMCVGDTTNHGYPEEWEQFTAIREEAARDGLPPMYFAVGNHDMHFYKYRNELGYQTDFRTQQNLYLRHTRTDSGNLYHYHILDGNYFIFLGPDRSIEPGENDCYVHISEVQRAWLSALLAEAAARGTHAFLFLHQPLCETVSGSLCATDPVIQIWNGVFEDAALREITDRYPNLVMFTGHTHWKFDSLQPVLPGCGKTASYANAASVAYLWTDRNGMLENEENAPGLGSEGLFVEEYDDFILLKGYDFAADKWSAAAYFLLETRSGTQYC